MPVSEDLAFATIATLAKGLREKKYTSVELAEFFLARLEQWGPRFNAVVTITRDLALKQARQADEDLAAGRDRSLLQGIPYGAKDLLAVPGYPTSWGAAPLKQQEFADEATVIARLREAGAVLVCKLAMIELAGGFGYRQGNASFTGPVKNPWNPATWAGGSSSGSGAAVAAGLVPFALGSETWGSIVTPVSYCGLTGLRPTYGRVSRQGAMALSWTMDKIGPMTHSAEDCSLVLAIIAGRDPHDDSTVDRPHVHRPVKEGQRFRIARVRDAKERLQPEIAANLEATVAELAKFCDVQDLTLPDLPYGTAAGTLIDCEMAAAFDSFVTSGQHWDLTAPEDRAGGLAAMVIPAKDYIHACRMRARMQRELDAALAGFDAVVGATTATVACPLDRNFGEYQAGWAGSALGAAGNVTGLPAVALPNGWGEQKLPTSCQLVGRAFSEEKLLAISQAYQQATDWHRQVPKLSL